MDTVEHLRAPFGDALRECASSEFSGSLLVDGRPGGVIYLQHGGVVACRTPGAPSLEVIVLRSGRLSEAAWNAAFAAAAVSDRQTTAELVDRGLLGAGELEALLRIAIADAVFAIASGHIANWRTESSLDDYPLLLSPAADTDWLLAESARRAEELARLPGPALSATDRVAPASSAGQRSLPPGQDHDALLALADGRRTVRDLAFARGHGLYATMLDLASLRADGLIATSPSGEASQPTSSAKVRPGSGDSDETGAGLPRRRKGGSGFQLTGGRSRRNQGAGPQLLRACPDEARDN